MKLRIYTIKHVQELKYHVFNYYLNIKVIVKHVNKILFKRDVLSEFY